MKAARIEKIVRDAEEAEARWMNTHGLHGGARHEVSGRRERKYERALNKMIEACDQSEKPDVIPSF